MITEPLMDLISERALTIARQLQWTWISTERTDDGVTITLTMTITGATSQLMTTQIHRLESILEALGWHLSNVQLGQGTATVKFDYSLSGPPTGQYPTLEETEPEAAT
jgi:hypothetical protein